MKAHHVIFIVLLIATIGAYFYLEHEKAGDLESQPITVDTPQTPVDATPEIQYPINASTENASSQSAEKTEEETLPTLEESDDRIKNILAEIVGSDLVNLFFKTTGLIHRFVVTIDSLPKEELPVKYRLLPPTPGKFLIKEASAETFILDPENFKRYDSAMQLLKKLDTEQFVKWYTRFYPLIQETYDSLGYNNQYFNDRFIFVIDHLLETPELTDSIELMQHKIFYNFARPDLQKLSAGQKILIRIGPENAAMVKEKLAGLRKQLTSPHTQE